MLLMFISSKHISKTLDKPFQCSISKEKEKLTIHNCKMGLFRICNKECKLICALYTFAFPLISRRSTLQNYLSISLFGCCWCIYVETNITILPKKFDIFFIFQLANNSTISQNILHFVVIVQQEQLLSFMLLCDT